MKAVNVVNSVNIVNVIRAVSRRGLSVYYEGIYGFCGNHDIHGFSC